MTAYNYRKITQKLKKLGFRLYRHGKGSHEIWVNEESNTLVPIPHHGSRDIRSGTLRAIVRQIGLKNEKGLDEI